MSGNTGGAKLLHASRPDAEPAAIRVARPVTLAPPLDALTLELVLAQDASVFAPIRWVGWGYLLVGFTTLILVAAAARRRAMALTARITRLSDAAKELPSGARGSSPSSPEPLDEVDTVARAFDGALRQLRAVQDSLEEKVQERTAALEQSERELRQSREQLSHAIESSRLGVWSWDLPTGQVSYNALWPTLLGYGPDELGTSFTGWAALVHPEDVERVGQEVVAHAKGLTPLLDTQYRMRAKDGSWRWVHSRGRVVERDREGRAVQVAGTHSEVTWRKTAEDRLRQAAAANERLLVELKASEERLRLSLASGTHAEWDWDVELDQFSLGSRWWEMLGVEPGDIAATLAGWESVLHPEDRERARAALFASVEGGADAYEGHYRIRTSAGQWRWVRSRGRVVARRPDGRATRMAGTRTDVTEVEDLQNRLVVATRLASVGTLAAGVAHEINNPLSYALAGISSAHDLLAGVEPLEPHRAVLCASIEEARHGAERIKAIVKSMRSLGRPERDDGPREVDVREELLDAIQLVRNQLVQRARLEVSVEDDLPRLQARTSELGRAFLNLLVNAAQAIPEGHPDGNSISILARRSGSHILVEVADSGTGIAPHDRDRIFEAFYTTKPVGTGTGLGLTIALTIVQSAGGTLEVEAGVGRGSVFRVRLPVSPQASSAPCAPCPSPATEPARRRVLVIDDDPMVRRSLERDLRKAHEVVALGSASEALARISAGETWDVILCDLMMTGLDGIGFYEAVTASHPAIRGHIAFVTGGAFGDRATRFLAANQVTIVEKPVERSELFLIVEQLATKGGIQA